MKRKCVTSNLRENFEKQCNALLESGWSVIPGTVSTSISSTHSGWRDSTFVEEIYVAFFEKPGNL